MKGKKQKWHKTALFFMEMRLKMAERGGFEPPVRFPVRRFSKPVLSAAQPPLRMRFAQCFQTG